jgi:pyruvate/2-oxoglutarate dehydrogenase complex dihydrolipoamide acyltransferase (E2) component
MGVSVAEGTLIEWRKAKGDRVERNEVIAAISTDKIDTDVEAPAAGWVDELLVAVGETVAVGTVLARIATSAPGGNGHAPPDVAPPDAAPPEASVAPDASEAGAALHAPGDAGELQGDTAARHVETAQRFAPKPGGRRYSPVVLRIAAEHGIDLEAVTGTGRGGRVRKQDVLAAVANGTTEPPLHIESPYKPDAPAPRRVPAPRLAPPRVAAAGALGPATEVPLSRMRRSIARHMVDSLHTAATCTTVIEVDMTRVETVRRRDGLTGLPYVARATIEALREHPALNATLAEDTLTTWDAVHLGFAVSLGGDGLLVPVIHHAHELSVEGLAARVRDVAARARAGELSPDELRGGTFTITNPGPHGTLMATPVINQPQVAILDTESVTKRPVVVTDADGNDSIAIRSIGCLCLSWDHRALDGELAARFLASIRRRLETWPLG